MVKTTVWLLSAIILFLLILIAVEERAAAAGVPANQDKLSKRFQIKNWISNEDFCCPTSVDLENKMKEGAFLEDGIEKCKIEDDKTTITESEATTIGMETKSTNVKSIKTITATTVITTTPPKGPEIDQLLEHGLIDALNNAGQNKRTIIVSKKVAEKLNKLRPGTVKPYGVDEIFQSLYNTTGQHNNNQSQNKSIFNKTAGQSCQPPPGNGCGLGTNNTRYQIFVQMDGTDAPPIIVDVQPETTVFEVKNLFQENEHIPADLFYLVFQGKRLADECASLCSNHIDRNNTVLLILSADQGTFNYLYIDHSLTKA